MNNRVIRCYQLSWKCKFATVKSLNADASSISPLSAFKFFTLANLHFRLSWLIILLYSPTNIAPQFRYKLNPFIHNE